MASVDASKLVWPTTTLVGAGAVVWAIYSSVGGAVEAMRTEQRSSIDRIAVQHTELRHEVELMRKEMTYEQRQQTVAIEGLARAVDLGVSTTQAQSWIELFRARLQAVDPKLVPTVPDLPARR